MHLLAPTDATRHDDDDDDDEKPSHIFLVHFFRLAWSCKGYFGKRYMPSSQNTQCTINGSTKIA